MAQYQDDDFSKAYTTALYRTKGIVQTNVQVKGDENLEIDLLFVSNLDNSAWEKEDLGVFDRLMTVHPTIAVEHYSGYLRPDHILRCISRMDFYVAGEKKEAKKRGERLPDQQKPFTWMIATACSETILRSFWARPDRSFGPGIYRIAPGFRVGIVVVRELPETFESMWLRGLGKDQILTNAFAQIRGLPETKRERNDIVEVCIKHFKYLIEKSTTGLSEEEDNFMKTMQEIDTIYQAEMGRIRSAGQEEGREEGREEADRANVEGMLIARFGAIDPELERVIPRLIDLDPIKRAQSIITLSREALLELR